MNQCSEYDSSRGVCKSGHVQLHPLCRGVDAGYCKQCGAGSVPSCLKDDMPAHLVRHDGTPLNWPQEQQP